MKTKNILFVLFVLLFLNFNLIAQCPDPVHPDYQAMMDLYNSTNGTSWTNKTGWEAGAAGTNCDPCSGWYGVTCNGNGRVIGINLPGNNLTGYISNIYFEELIELYLQQNQIEGTLPEINCAKLQYIEFSTNNFTSINTIFGINAPLLAAYVLGDNDLIGCISSSYNSLCSQGTQVFLGGNPGFDSNSWANFCSNGTGECSYTQLPVNVAVNFPNQICHGDPFDISVNLNGGNPPFDIKLILESDPENHLLEVNGVNSYQHTFTIDPLQTPQAYPNVGSMPNYAVKVGGLTSPDTYVTFIYNDEIGEIPPSGNSEVAQCGSQPCPTSAQISNEYSICDDSPILFTVDINDGTPPFHIAVHAINTLTNQDNIIVGEFNGQLGSNSYIINPGDANYLINGEYQIRTKINNSNGFDSIFLCMPEFSILSPNNLIITEGFGMACQPTNATSNSVGSCTLNLTQNDTYTLEWDGQSTGSLILTGQLLNIPDLSVGSYFLTVTNSQGCIKTCDFEIRFDNGGIGCQHPDYSELMKLYNSTGGPNWKRNGTVSEPNSTISGWNKDCDICNWYGVRCNTNNRVVCIDLDGIDNCKWDFNSGNNNMIGTIPALSFEEVEFFNLSNNGLSGSLSGLTLPKIKSLNITDSKLNGNLTDFDFNKPALEEIRLQYSQLSGSIPNFILPNLKVVDLGGNQLSGELPLLNTPNLEILSFGGNKTLIGTIPLYILPKLNTLYLHDNKFEGNIPSLDLPLLNLLWLNNNNLSGCIPSIFQQNCGILTDIQLSENLELFPSWDDFCNNNAGICDDTTTCPIKITFNFPDTTCQDIGFNVYVLTEGGSLPYLIDWYLNDTLSSSLLITDSIKFNRDTSYFSMMNAPTIFGSATPFSLIPKIREINVSSFENNCDDVLISGVKSISIKNCDIFISNDTFDVLQAAPLDLQYQCLIDSFKFIQYPEQYRFSICDRVTLFYFINLKKDIDFIARVLVKKDGQIVQTVNFQSINNPIIGKGGYVWWLCNFLQLDNPGSYQLEFYIIDANTNQDYLVNSAQVIIDDIPEYRILKSLYDLTGGQNWSFRGTKDDPGSMQNGWSKDCDYCNWFGVTCDQNKRVVSINLEGNNLSGTLPDLSGLEKLQILKFDNNLLIGSVPNFSLLELFELDFSNNKFSGNISDFMECPNLEKVWMHNNTLTGEIPEFDLKYLKDLHLGYNALSGQLPLLLKCPNLVQLILNDNKLSGQIPQNYGLFNSLNNLILWNNNLEGCIHQELKLLCNRLLIGDIIKNNPNLSTDSWDAFCNNDEGICCFKPLVQGFSITGSIDVVNEVELKNYGLYPEMSSLKIIEIRNNQLNQYDCSEEGILSYSFDKHFFGEVEVVVEACGLDCNECDTMVVKISDAYLPYIHPTNAFTPNVGTNQTLRFNDDDNIPESELFIYNRWGDRIYYTKDYTNDWDADGYPGGIYFYVLKVQDVILKSTLTIIK